MVSFSEGSYFMELQRKCEVINSISSVGVDVSPCKDKVQFLRPEMMNVSQTVCPPVAI